MIKTGTKSSLRLEQRKARWSELETTLAHQPPEEERQLSRGRPAWPPPCASTSAVCPLGGSGPVLTHLHGEERGTP